MNKSTDSTRETAAGVIASQLEAIGIHVEIVTAGFTLGDSNSEYAQMLENKDFDIALVGFNLARDCDILPYIDASCAYNYGGYRNDALSALARSLNTARDEAACREAADEYTVPCVRQRLGKRARAGFDEQYCKLVHRKLNAAPRHDRICTDEGFGG